MLWKRGYVLGLEVSDLGLGLGVVALALGCGFVNITV